MDATELFLSDGRPAGVWFCGTCRAVAGEHKSAENCCAPRKCADCGAGLPRAHCFTVCDPCRHVRDAAKELARFEAATKLTVAEWGASDAGPMLFDAIADRFFDDLDTAEDWYAEDDERTRPAYLWCTKLIKWKPDVSGDLRDEMYGNMHEGADENIPDSEWDRLDAFVNAWWEANRVNSYEPDYKRCVLLPERADSPAVVEG